MRAKARRRVQYSTSAAAWVLYNWGFLIHMDLDAEEKHKLLGAAGGKDEERLVDAAIHLFESKISCFGLCVSVNVSVSVILKVLCVRLGRSRSWWVSIKHIQLSYIWKIILENVQDAVGRCHEKLVQTSILKCEGWPATLFQFLLVSSTFALRQGCTFNQVRWISPDNNECQTFLFFTFPPSVQCCCCDASFPDLPESEVQGCNCVTCEFHVLPKSSATNAFNLCQLQWETEMRFGIFGPRSSWVRRKLKLYVCTGTWLKVWGRNAQDPV